MKESYDLGGRVTNILDVVEHDVADQGLAFRLQRFELLVALVVTSFE